MKKFNNKVIVVSGSSRGIGKSIAYEFAKEGAIIILHASHKSSNALISLKKVKKLSPKSELHIAKIENYRYVMNFSKKIKNKFKKINYLINNAGINKDKTFKKMSIQEWDNVIKINLYGVFNMVKAFLPLIKSNGRIINMSSVVGQIGAYGQTNYAASKAAIIGFTKSLALEVIKKKITVNAICPGYTETSMLKKIPKNILKNLILPKIPLKRLAKPKEIAKLVIFLCSSDADYITGQCLNINGGLI